MDELIQLCTKWSSDRGIFVNGTIQTQTLKLVSEIGELADNVAKQRDIADDIGDCLVVLNNLAVMYELSLEECLEVAYLDIKDRKGYLNGAGVFIKDSDRKVA
tara:strand:+ start:285 stop:593 length:309 start_codon:yes stop_codon:yes gene_type:complete